MAIIYHPQTYRLPDKAQADFIDEDEIVSILDQTKPTDSQVREVIQRALGKNRLSLYETAILLKADSPELINEIKQAARELKERVYGKRIVLFAPLYIGNLCVNNCAYCGFRTDNKKQVRTTLGASMILLTRLLHCKMPAISDLYWCMGNIRVIRRNL
jgi:2-iminoacetate synthase